VADLENRDAVMKLYQVKKMSTKKVKREAVDPFLSSFIAPLIMLLPPAFLLTL
jgi:hypothetical protein